VPSTRSLSNWSLASDPSISGAKGAARSYGRLRRRGGALCGATPSRRCSSQCASGRFASNLGTIRHHLLLRRKAEDVILPGPFGWQIDEASYPHEIVMFTLRVLQLSRFAMLSLVAVGSPMSSSSQRRPRAIEAISVARFSELLDGAFATRPLRAKASRGGELSLPFATAHEGCCQSPRENLCPMRRRVG
jgi:hypothetical protein